MITLIEETEFLPYAIKCMPAKQIIAPFGLNGLFLQELLKLENNFGRNTKKEYKNKLYLIVVALNNIKSKTDSYIGEDLNDC